MGTFLTREDLIKMTGARQRALQIKNLRDNNISFTIAVDGRPRVLWENVIINPMPAKDQKSDQPKLDWMDG